MEHQKIINNEHKIIEFGYNCFPPLFSKLTIEDLLSEVKESIIVTDTKGVIIDVLLSKATSLLIDKTKLFMGLVSYEFLKSMKSKGINSGFFRSTTATFDVAIVIIDKRQVFVCFDSHHIYPLAITTNEIFDYFNHLLWAHADAEYVLGSLKVIKESNLTVPAPVIMQGHDYSDLRTKTMKYGTVDLNHDILLSSKEVSFHPSSVFSASISSACGESLDHLYVRIFADKYYPIKADGSLFSKVSFQNMQLSELVGKTLSINGKEFVVKTTDKISKTIYKPLDEFESYIPDFDAVSNEYTQLTKELLIQVEVLPLMKDKTYIKHDRYSDNQKFVSSLNQAIAKLNKLLQSEEDEELLEQLKRIESESNLKEKVRLFNDFIKNEDYGIAALTDKKMFDTLQYKPSYEVPNSLIGTLYTKNNMDYFALPDKTKIELAKAWLKEQNMQAVLVQDHG